MMGTTAAHVGHKQNPDSVQVNPTVHNTGFVIPDKSPVFRLRIQKHLKLLSKFVA